MEANDAASYSATSISSAFAQLMTALAKIIGICVDYNSPSNNGIWSRKRNLIVNNCKSSSTIITNIDIS